MLALEVHETSYWSTTQRSAYFEGDHVGACMPQLCAMLSIAVSAYLKPTQAEKGTGEYRRAAVVYAEVSCSGRNHKETRTAGEPKLDIWPSADEIG